MNKHIESPDIASIVETNPSALLIDDDLYARFLGQLTAEIKAFEPDLSTAASRKEIASRAYAVTKKKTAIDAAGKKLNEDASAQINAVNAKRRQVREDMEALADEARKPLTNWEKQEEARVEYCKSILKAIEDCGNGFIGGEPQPFLILLRELEEKIVINSELGEFEDQARVAHRIALDKVKAAYEAHQRSEADRIELEKLRAEKAERDRLESERMEKDRLAAEAAKHERLEQERREREKAEQKSREEAAAERAREEERRKAQDAIDRAEAEARAVREKAEREERERLEALERSRREDQERAADREHRGKIMGEAKAALMAQGAGEPMAKKIVLAIIAGEIPHVTMKF
ncbi:hypothetical protein C7441_11084 [Pseudaminobacter salicylatoxidans]|uniref:Uncharacterized protein n=1 Tax=Pseudaminobacter salicylatoxidans TaxID=93369 RepID=A0A316C0M9_PSESE|nr:hypothetical protein [Pseudaminobacter salicylatoxidans]PWJ81552.1 hypothetical protein C7441_11084 [Pseudaminobacter salicylatoxidans]